MIAAISALVGAIALASCFQPPVAVDIVGWANDAMEPFLSRDGKFLFFNSSNEPGRQTDIYWAARIDNTHFRLKGPLPGANSSALDGVPSLARNGAFALISPRAYDRLHATVWIGRWNGTRIDALKPQAALSPPEPGGFNMDAEISADGQRLYFTDNQWSPRGGPASSRLRLARLTAVGWRVDRSADVWFATINGVGLVYAPAVSEDERELFFTRVSGGPATTEPEILVATRADARSPFSKPARIAGLGGFVEGPSVAADGAVYFHARKGDRFVIMRSARVCRCGA